MSGVRQLVVSGLRSFGGDEDDKQHLVFWRPLTLILGENGCGKTTIVEALKFALCDELPPNSDHGRSFVHDPKIDNCREMLAQVRLEFTDAKNSNYFVARSLQTQIKQKKMQFQRLDNFLKTMDERGNQVEISGRCGDINSTICSVLGVSKAILNNVIFCHQEDSNWPLEEGKKLKERFDAIFDATKYNKCFEHIRKMRKQYANDVKILDEKVQHSSDMRREAEKKKRKLFDDEEKIKNLDEKLDQMQAELKPIRKRLQEIDSIETNLGELKSRRKMAKDRSEYCKTEQNGLKKGLKEMYTGTDDELKKDIESFEANLESKEASLKDSHKNLSSLQAKEKGVNSKISSCEIQKSELFTLEGQNQERTSQRNDDLLQLAVMCKITKPNIHDEDDATTLFAKIKSHHTTIKQKLEESSHNMELQEKSLQTVVDKCRDALTRHQGTINNKEAENKNLTKQIKKIETDIEDANQSKSNLDNIKKQMDVCDIEIEAISSGCDMNTLKNSINDDEAKINELEPELEGVENMVLALQKQQKTITEINMKKELLANKQKNFTRTKNKNKDAMTDLLGENIPDNNFNRTFKDYKDNLKREIETLDKNLKIKKNKITSLEANRKHCKEDLDVKKSELSTSEEKIFNLCKGQSFDEVLNKIDNEIGKLQDQKMEFSSAEFVLKKYMKTLQDSNPLCPLCHQGFEHQQDVSDLIAELEEKIRGVPKNLDNVLHSLNLQIKKRDEFISLRPLNEKISNLKNVEIPVLEKKLLTYDSDLSKIQDDVDEIVMSLMDPESKLATVESILSDMPLLDQLFREISTITSEISMLETKLNIKDGDMTMDEASSKQAELRQKISSLRLTLKSNQSILNTHNEKLNSAREKKNLLNEKYLKAQAKVQELTALQSRFEEIKIARDSVTEEILSLKKGISKLNEDLTVAKNNKEETIQKLKNGLKEDRKFESQVDKKFCAIQKINGEIETHNKKDVTGDIEKLRILVEKLTKELDELSEKIKNESERISQIKDEISNQMINKRRLEDNLKIRQLESERFQLENEIKTIDEKAGKLNYNSLSTEKMSLLTTSNNITLDIAKKQGEKGQLQVTVKETRVELMQKEYKDIDNQYRTKLYELELLKAADKDLKDYSFALDCCLMKYHKEKMEKINFIIRDMWRNIYRGNDIDYIEIKTDESSSQTTAGSRRVYDYRVVQRRNDAEIDMRGRCSAGQKVLASLIIRMALAETFSNRFGVLALDEPTANLDRDNITSLCCALRDMITSRMKQSNFMFIIITHDAEFLNSLGQIDKIRHYYKVTRNQDGKSRITKEVLP